MFLLSFPCHILRNKIFFLHHIQFETKVFTLNLILPHIFEEAIFWP